MSRPLGRRPAEAGFALLEVIVSLAVLSLCLLALVGAVAGGVRALAQADRTARALAVAESRLAAALHGPADDLPGGGKAEGEEGAFRWRLAVAPYREGGTAFPASAWREARFLLVEVTVEAGPDGPPMAPVSLRALRLAAPDAAMPLLRGGAG